MVSGANGVAKFSLAQSHKAEIIDFLKDLGHLRTSQHGFRGKDRCVLNLVSAPMRSLKLVVVVVWFAALIPCSAQSPANDADRRANEIISKMTLEEKVDMLGGLHEFFIRPLP